METIAPQPSMPSTFDIFEYRHSSELLDAYVRHRKTMSRHFSISGWAKKLELTSSGILVNFMKKRRLPPEELTVKIAESMRLDADETEYLLTLVACERAESHSPMALHELRKKLNAICYRKQKHTIPNEEMRPILTPAAIAVKALLEIQTGPLTIETLKARLRIPVSIEELERIVSSLADIGVIAKEANGAYSTHTQSIESQNDVPSQPVRDFHKASLAIASQALDEVPTETRHFTSYIMNIDPTRMKAAKKMCDEFRDQFVSQFECTDPSAATEVYQINLNLVPLTGRSSPRDRGAHEQ